MIKRYTPEQLDFIWTGYQSMNVRDLTKAFNDHFGLDKTEKAIRSTLRNHKITCGRKGQDRLKKRTKQLTRGQEQFLQDTYKGISATELTDLFNDRFSTNKTLQQIKSFVHNHGINSGRTGQFTKGDMPWNTGTRGVMKPNSGNFKKGDIPANIKPLGDERICKKDGFILIKVVERDPYTTRYKHKHRHVWEQNFGPVPEGMVVAFKDADKTNCELNNLMLISRAELLTLNRHGYREMPAELKPSVLALSKLQVKTRTKEKEA